MEALPQDLLQVENLATQLADYVCAGNLEDRRRYDDAVKYLVAAAKNGRKTAGALRDQLEEMFGWIPDENSKDYYEEQAVVKQYLEKCFPR